MKSETLDRKYLFEKAPVPKALATFAVPTVISQLVAMIYNLADTYFVGLTNDPYKVAAVTLCFVLFMTLNAFGQLFGIGGGALTSKLLGAHREDDAKRVGCFSFYSSLIVCAVLCIGVYCFEDPILRLIGSSDNTIEFSRQYINYVVVLGGIPTVQSISLSHLLRNEGYSKQASRGLTMGGLINLALDPLFMFVIMEPGMEVAGAAIATMISNYIVFIYYIVFYLTHKKNLIINLNIKNFRAGVPFLGQILSIGFPSFCAPFLANIANSTLNRLCSGYGDVAVAALGIAKKIDMLPMNSSLGLCQGMVALVSYNFANKNFKRMKSFIDTTRWVGIAFAVCCIIVFEIFPTQVVSLFIKDPETVEIGVIALRRLALSTPFMICVFHMVYTYQSMGYGWKSLILSSCRQGLVNIPMMFVMNKLLGLEGLYWNQLVSDIIVICVAVIFYRKDMKRLKIAMSGETEF